MEIIIDDLVQETPLQFDIILPAFLLPYEDLQIQWIRFYHDAEPRKVVQIEDSQSILVVRENEQPSLERFFLTFILLLSLVMFPEVPCDWERGAWLEQFVVVFALVAGRDFGDAPQGEEIPAFLALADGLDLQWSLLVFLEFAYVVLGECPIPLHLVLVLALAAHPQVHYLLALDEIHAPTIEAYALFVIEQGIFELR